MAFTPEDPNSFETLEAAQAEIARLNTLLVWVSAQIDRMAEMANDLQEGA